MIRGGDCLLTGRGSLAVIPHVAGTCVRHPENACVGVQKDRQAPKLTAAQLSAIPVLAALESYHAWLPEAVTEANFDAGRLLTKVRMPTEPKPNLSTCSSS